MTGRFARLFLAGMVVAGSFTAQALATFDQWIFAELFSNASGTVQFIEMADSFDGETFLQGISVQSGGHTFTFPSNLPLGTPTAGHRLLLATPGYFELSGVPPADYNLGVNGFFDPSGDTLVFSGGLDSIAFNAAQLPIDDLLALVRETPTRGAPISTAVNSPTNVTGQSGSFPRWQNLDDRFNVNALSGVTPVDVLQLINELLSRGSHVLPEPEPGMGPPPYFDVSGDNAISPQDVLQVINRILQRSADSSIGAAPAAIAIFSVPEPRSHVLALCGAVLLVVAPASRRLWRAGNRLAKIL